jgi:hypothetical protein
MMHAFIKKKLIQYSLLHKMSIIFLFFLLFFYGCVNTNENQNKFFEEYSIPYSTKEDNSPLISYNYTDINPYITSGLVWTPFILPNESWISLHESDFLIGYWNGGNNPILAPEPGICRILEDSNVDSLPKGPMKLVYFTSDRINPEQDEKELFFLLSPSGQKPFAMVRLNADGKASCFISLKSYNISTGYGQYRKEIQVDGGETNVKVPFPENTYIKIDPKVTNGINEGDTLRIGRSISEHGISTLKSNYNEGNFLIPTKIEGDLFVSGNFESKNMGVDEYLKTSILVGKKPFEIQLEPSSYTFAVLRKNKLICLKNVNLKESEIYELSCPKIQKDDIDFEDETKNYYFDASIFPSSIIETKQFQDWAFSSPNYFLLTSPNYYQDYIYKKEEELNLIKQFSFMYQNSKTKLVRYLPNTYTVIAPSDIKKSDLTQLYLGVTSNITSSYISSLRNNSANHYYLGIPLGGTGEQNIANNAVPFSSFTKLIRIVPTQDFLKMSNVQASNGVLFYLFEPLTLPQNEGLLSSYVQQRFRLRIMIPAWNSTNVVEMYINGKIHRRWILDRGDISKPYAKSFEEGMSETKAFTVRWVAWGEDFLSDFLTGTKNTLPFAMTRDYCIDTVGDGICHVEQEK